ncbi:TraM recognition domain-containing protein [Bdellovibrionota bacterium FG-1]
MFREQWALAGITAGAMSGIFLTRHFDLFRKRGLGIRVGRSWISDEARLRHTHIVGATGTGKTVLLEQLICEDIKRGNGGLIIDPKGDRELYERVRAECKKLGREGDLHLLSATHLDESSVWNPCGLGNVSELQSKFFNSAIYEEPHYAKWCERALLQAFNELVPEWPQGFTVADLVKRLEDFVQSKKGQDQKMEGLFLDLYNLANGEWGPILCCGKSTFQKPEISLLDITQRNQILFVDLPTEAKKVQSARIGRLLTQELMLISGLRKIHPGIKSEKPFSVYIDEFDAFATESFATFLNKGRSSGFMIHIAHQTLSDLNQVGEDFAGQILGNCNVRFIFRQDDPDDAERWSRFIGTRRSTKRTYQTQNGVKTGMSSNREVQEFVISPDRIKNLKIGQTVLSVKTSGICKVIRLKFKPTKLAGVEGPKTIDAPLSRGTGLEARRDLSPEKFGQPPKASQGPTASKWQQVKKISSAIVLSLLCTSCAFHPSPTPEHPEGEPSPQVSSQPASESAGHPTEQSTRELPAQPAVPSPSITPVTSPSPSPSPSAIFRDGALLSISVGWEGQEKLIELSATEFTKKDSTTYGRELPISLPAKVPEEVTFKILLNQEVRKLENRRIEAYSVGGNGLMSHSIGVKQISVTSGDLGTTINACLQGLPLLLSNKEEQRAFISIRILSENRIEMEFKALLVTPPSQLVQIPRDQFTPKLPATLNSQALELKQIDRVAFLNRSWAPISLSLPFIQKAKFTARLMHFEISEVPTEHVALHYSIPSIQTQVRESELLVVPNLPGIESNWPRLSNEDYRRVTIQPGEQLEIGFYAPKAISDFLAPLQKLTSHTVRTTIDSAARCPDGYLNDFPVSKAGDEGRWYCLQLNSGMGYSFTDEGIQACCDSVVLMRKCVASNWAREPCNAAALADDKVDRLRVPRPGSTIPWPSWLGCRRVENTTDGSHLYFIHKAWTWEAVEGDLPEGLQFLDSHAELIENDAAEGVMRFDLGNPAANREGRTLQLFGKILPIKNRG